MLNNEQISCYRQNGFVKAEQLFDKKETDALASEMVNVIERVLVDLREGIQEPRSRQSLTFLRICLRI